MGEATERYAVVTGANKGIGLEIVRQLASEGIKVVLTATNEERGLQALETLKASGLSHLLLFHQLDVAHAASVAAFAAFIKSKFGKLDILVNNAGIDGVVIEDRDLITTVIVNRGVSFNLLEKYLEAHSKASMWENELLDVGYQPLCIQIPYTSICAERTVGMLFCAGIPRVNGWKSYNKR